MAELYKSVTELMKIARGNKALRGSLGDITDFQQIIDDTPTADVVEVVRCKDCEHAEKVIHRGEEMPDIFRCTYLRPNTTLFDIDFCRYGKRRDTE